MGIKKGFTLIEVCLVLMIFGIAITSLMALFPVSLRQGNMAASDSALTTFGDNIMNSLAANAAQMKDWADWEDEKKFAKAIVKNIAIDTGNGPLSGHPLKATGMKKNGEDSVDKYLGIEKSFIKYKLSFSKVTIPKDFDGRLYRATLRVTDNKNGKVADGIVFVSYFVYGGEIP